MGPESQEGARKLLHEYGVKLVYATLGPKGCCRDKERRDDRLLAQGHPRRGHHRRGRHIRRQRHEPLLKLNRAIDDLTESDLQAIVRFGCCAASLSTQTHGGITSVVPLEQVEFCVSASY